MNLFIPVVKESRWHPNFRALYSLGNAYLFDVIQDWARGFVDRDRKFVVEFQTEFNPCFWELYLFAVLKKYGYAVDFTKGSPDFCIPKLNLSIEATIASNARGATPEFAKVGLLPPADLNTFNKATIIRLANSVSAKHRAYLNSYAKLDHVAGRPFVVTVTNFDQPFGFLATHRPIEALLLGLYVDEGKYMAKGGTGPLLSDRMPIVTKENGSPIELGMFTSPKFKEVSAVIFSGCATIGKVRALSSDPITSMVFSALRLNLNSIHPHVIQETKRRYEESLLDGLRVYHNPFATHPLDASVFRHPSVFQLYVDVDGREAVEQREGLLLARRVSTQIEVGKLT